MALEDSPPIKDSFSGEIVVAARIIEFVSSGLYESPAACLKELINNSYDADATSVKIFVKPDADRIIIEDNGAGMSREEFEKHFKRVSESHKRDDSDFTSSGRPKIGKIGIGFIAANELCDVLEIYSSKEGSSDLLHVIIDFKRLREESPEDRRRGDEELAQGDYQGEVLEATRSDHYTQIFLTGVRQNARPLLAGAERKRISHPGSLYGLRPESVAQKLLESDLKSWASLDPYSETMLLVGLNVPVKFAPGWLPSKQRKPFVRRMEEQVNALRFAVKYDGADLRKPVVFSGNKSIVKPFKFRGEHVAAEGYFYGQHGTIRPHDLQGLLLRIRNAAVGTYDRQFWDYPTTRFSLIQRWVSAEVWADDRLEPAMNIDRQTLRVTLPAYVELQEAIHSQLDDFFQLMRTQVYGAEAESRRQRRAEYQVESVREAVSERIKSLGPATARDVDRAWTGVITSGRESVATRKMTVSELYDLVLDVAEETLDPTERRAFIRALTERLTNP
jgi:anti-sigma regulatory factor (Ser/Thr protein kinase)